MTAPRALRDPQYRTAKLARIDSPHVGPLNELVRSWRSAAAGRRIPWFDPADGGVHAQVLVLMEAPGPRTVRDGAAGFCSEDNDDPTAATLWELRRRSGLRRASYLRWNVVPWALHAPDGHWRAPTDDDLRLAAPPLADLVALLPDLQLIICMGAKALSGVMRHITLTGDRPPFLILGVPHPSVRNARARAEAVARIENALRIGAEVATGCSD